MNNYFIVMTRWEKDAEILLFTLLRFYSIVASLRIVFSVFITLYGFIVLEKE